MGQFRSFSQEYILDHKEFEGLKCLFCMVQVGIAHHWVLTHDIQPLNPPFHAHGIYHISKGQPWLCRDLYPPDLLDPFYVFMHIHGLISWELVWQAPHIACTLNVVLPPQRVDPCPWFAYIPGQHRQIDNGMDTVYDVDMLGAAHGPEYLSHFSLTV